MPILIKNWLKKLINGDNVCLGVVVGHWSGQVPAFTTILENLFPSMSTNETKNQVQAQNTAASKGHTFALFAC